MSLYSSKFLILTPAVATVAVPSASVPAEAANVIVGGEVYPDPEVTIVIAPTASPSNTQVATACTPPEISGALIVISGAET